VRASGMGRFVYSDAPGGGGIVAVILLVFASMERC